MLENTPYCSKYGFIVFCNLPSQKNHFPLLFFSHKMENPNPNQDKLVIIHMLSIKKT